MEFERSRPTSWLAGFSLAATTTLLAPCVAAADPKASTIDIAALRADARHALADGRLASASSLYESLLARDPVDLEALREGGRTALAIQSFARAAELLERAVNITKGRDPELHYLRGEALWVLGREAEARVSYARARQEIGAAPADRLARLWLARIYARIGDRTAADSIYDAMAAEAPADSDVALAQAEMHATAHDWPGAEDAIRRFLSVRPTHRGAREMLAWITEARGQLSQELALRAGLAHESTSAQPVRDYGRALERAGDWAAALAMYRRAQTLAGGHDDPALAVAKARMAQRMSIEVAAGATAKSDPTADAVGGFTGIAVPFGRAHHAAFGVHYDRVSRDDRNGSVTELAAAASLGIEQVRVIAGTKLALSQLHGDRAGVMPGHSAATPGGFAGARRSVGNHVELGLDGEIHTPWRDTPRALLEQGTVDSLTSHVWGTGFDHRLVVDTGAQVRRLRLRPDEATEPVSSQLFAWAGVDCELWHDFAQQARGEVLDDELLHPTYLASSVVASYRHYESFASTNDSFMARMGIADRASIDEVSLTVRRAAFDGRLGLESRGGVGYDQARSLWLARGGFSLWVATGSSSRLALTLDLARENTRALEGERLSGGMTYHVDLF